MGLVLSAQGAGQAGWHLLCCLLPTWAAGSSLEGDVLHLGPQGTPQLSAQSLRCASQFLLLCRGVSAQTRHPTKDRGTVIQKKMNFLQEPRPSGIPGQGMRDPCRGGPIAHRMPGCSPWKRDAGKDPLSPSLSFKNVPWCVIWQFQHFELNYGN